jgi:hypothetical protein
MISRFLNSFLLGFLFIDCVERRFPDQFKNFAMNVSYNCIYYYSKCQIFFIKYISKNPIYLKIMKTIESKTKSTENRLGFIFVKDNFHYNIDIDSPDLIVVGDLSKNPVPKRIVYEQNYTDIDFEESKIKFMLIEFTIGVNSYKINLKTDTYNYYIVGNKFTKDFFIFYVNEYLLSKYDQHEINKEEKYTLKIIDNDVNSIDIDFTDQNESILLEKNGYKLL